jgi:NADH-quinone oxidoreductase subunit C
LALSNAPTATAFTEHKAMATAETDLSVTDLDEVLAARYADAIVSSEVAHGELTIVAKRDQIVPLMKALRDDAIGQFEVLIDLCGVDYPARAERFDVVYHLLSPRTNQRLRVKVTTNETEPVPSLCDVFPAANWYEREAYDMYGILFSDHPDLRRLLTDYGFSGYPLRKDFPLTGHVEVRYDDEQKRVVYEPVKLMQEFRSFDFESPWEGAEYILPGDEKASGEPPKSS